MIFSHYHRLSQQVQELLNNTRVVVLITTNRPYEQILKSELNFIYTLPENLMKILGRILLKMT